MEALTLCVVAGMCMCFLAADRKVTGRGLPAPWRQHAFNLAVLVTLLLVLNPEVRLLVLFVDAMGLELLLLYAVSTVRMAPLWCRNVAHVLWRGLCSFGPIPFSVPSARMLHRHPLWATASLAAAVPGLIVLGAPGIVTARTAAALTQML